MSKDKFELILNELSQTCSQVKEDELNKLADMIIESNKLFTVGVGRVLLAIMSGVKRFNHIGIKAYHVGQIDEPALTEGDLLIVASNSGESIFPVAVTQKAKNLDAKIAYIGSSINSTCAKLADLAVILPTASKLNSSGIKSKQPMTSLFEQSLLLICDVLAMMIIEKKQLNIEELWENHANLE